MAHNWSPPGNRAEVQGQSRQHHRAGAEPQDPPPPSPLGSPSRPPAGEGQPHPNGFPCALPAMRPTRTRLVGWGTRFPFPATLLPETQVSVSLPGPFPQSKRVQKGKWRCQKDTPRHLWASAALCTAPRARLRPRRSVPRAAWRRVRHKGHGGESTSISTAFHGRHLKATEPQLKAKLNVSLRSRGWDPAAWSAYCQQGRGG